MDPPRLRLICRVVSSSAIARASGKDRASRSSLVTTKVSPARQAASASRSPGLPVGAGQAVVDVDPLDLDTEAEQGVALSGQVLLIGGASGVPHKQRAHSAPPRGWPGRAAERGRLGHRAAPDLHSNALHRRSPQQAAGPQRDRHAERATDRSLCGDVGRLPPPTPSRSTCGNRPDVCRDPDVRMFPAATIPKTRSAILANDAGAPAWG